MTTDPAELAPTLPGLEEIERPPSKLEAAVRRTLSALAGDGALDERHAALMAMAVELADVIATKKTSRRLSTVSNDFAQLREVLEALAPTGDDGDADKKLREALEAWTAADA